MEPDMPPGYPSHEAPPSAQEPRRMPPPWPPRPPEAAPRTPPPWPPPPSEAAPHTPPPDQTSGYDYDQVPGAGSSGRLPTGGPPSGRFAPPYPAAPPRFATGGPAPLPRSSNDFAVRPIQPIQPAGREDSTVHGPRPRTRMPLTRALRTDPSLYQWDRLSPEQKAAVLAAIGNTPARFRPWLAVRPMLMGALIVGLLFVIAGVLLVIFH